MILLKAKDLYNNIVYLSEISMDRGPRFTHNIEAAFQFGSASSARSWFDEHCKNDSKLQNYYDYCIMSIAEEKLM